MRHIDLNCDMGEGIGNDAALMPFISSANIACGYHAGNEQTMNETVRLAIDHGVKIGAHVSFADKENFGRTEMKLPDEEVYSLVQTQLQSLRKITDKYKTSIHHVKPHGALYNMSARDAGLARIIAKAIAAFDPSLVLMGLSGSHSINEAKMLNLKTAGEAFADRRYEEDGSLRSRTLPGALLEDAGKAVQQVLQMINTGTVTAFSGKQVSVLVDTICIHGDGKHAVSFAKQIHQTLKHYSIDIKAV
ncbi:MAG: LamB/YcsF family protein [Citrobacter freundii]|nr:MAG: LamB/YcsF family protein [Citrobacter freundii]